MSDFLAKIERERKDRILSSGKYYGENYIYCPYCAREQTEIWEGFDLKPDGEEREGQCQQCERYFMYAVELQFNARKMK